VANEAEVAIDRRSGAAREGPVLRVVVRGGRVRVLEVIATGCCGY